MVNKRRGEPPIPPNHETLMTPEQREGLKKLETFGWHLHIVRRPKFEPVEVVLEHSGGQFAILTETGELDHDTPPTLRKEAEPMPADTGDTGDPWANATDNGDFEVRESPVDPEPATVNNEPVPTQGGNGKRPPKILV